MLSPDVSPTRYDDTDQPRADLFWSDPLGGSANDYDLFIIDQTNNIVRSSLDTQNGTQDPYESVETLNVGDPSAS